MIAADPSSQMLAELRACAYRLGLAFGGEAERAATDERRLEYFHLFDRCFFAVRVATALELRLRRAPMGVVAERASLTEREPLEREGVERDRSERELEGDRDRDRESEPASLPVLLRTLDAVAADAAALPGPKPAALPTLRELLASMGSGPAPAAAPRASSGGDLRARLAGSTTAPALALAAPSIGGRGGLAVRRATGPPRR